MPSGNAMGYHKAILGNYFYKIVIFPDGDFSIPKINDWRDSLAYVTVPKDLTKVKTKVLFGLTRRQLICFGTAAIIGIPLFFLTRKHIGSSAATACMILVMLPLFLLAMYERHGQPLEVILRQIIECAVIRPKERPYQTNNYYAALERQYKLEQEVKRIVQKKTPAGSARGNTKTKAHRRGKT